MSYKWEQISGPNESNIHCDKEKMTKVSNMITGEYVFKLIVTNQEDISASNLVTVVVTKKNIPDAGESQVIYI